MVLSPKASLNTGKRANQKRAGWELHSSSFDVTTSFAHADATLHTAAPLHLYPGCLDLGARPSMAIMDATRTLLSPAAPHRVPVACTVPRSGAHPSLNFAAATALLMQAIGSPRNRPVQKLSYLPGPI